MKTVDKLTIYDQGIVDASEEYGQYELRARQVISRYPIFLRKMPSGNA
jgi:menaquinone-dependent protoporphyrinogen IX oxidase